MPLYDYKCSKCGDVFEALQKMSDEPLKKCPKCKGPIKRLISSPGIIFKGSGFHVTDYAKKKKTEGGKQKTEKKLKTKADKK
ncbi:MAG: zinc ribbon domain-containing protein [Candidatus Saganbacteria bacterium]|nr:zinc ribbon domain-containing protein [Candidatus Saganbacteria bacterium]